MKNHSIIIVSLFILSFWSFESAACKTESAIHELRGDVLIELPLNQGLVLSGINTAPKVIETKNEKGNDFPHIMQKKGVERFEDTRNILERIFKKEGGYEKVSHKNWTEVKVSNEGFSKVEFPLILNLIVKEDQQNFRLKLVYSAPMRSKGGCGGIKVRPL